MFPAALAEAVAAQVVQVVQVAETAEAVAAVAVVAVAAAVVHDKIITVRSRKLEQEIARGQTRMLRIFADILIIVSNI